MTASSTRRIHRSHLNPLAKLCFFTSAGAAGIGLLSLIASAVGFSWSIYSGMFAVSLLYLGIGSYYLLEKKTAGAVQRTSPPAGAIPQPHHAVIQLETESLVETSETAELDLVHS